MTKCLLAAAVLVLLSAHCSAQDDPSPITASTDTRFEIRSGDPALSKWIEEQNNITLAHFEADPLYAKLKEEALAVYTDPGQLREQSLKNGYIYGVYSDAQGRPFWGKLSLKDFKNGNMAWEGLIALSELSSPEKNEFWTPNGMPVCLSDGTRCLVSLSLSRLDDKGALVSAGRTDIREFDTVKKRFVDGFDLKNLKGDLNIAAWTGPDSVAALADFGPGSFTDGVPAFPRFIKLLRRGEPSEKAKTLFAGGAGILFMEFDAFGGGSGGGSLVVREHPSLDATAYSSVAVKTAKAKKINVPSTAQFEGWFRGNLIFLLTEPWRGMTAGALVALNADAPGKAVKVWSPSGRDSVSAVSVTRQGLLVKILDDIREKILIYRSLPAKPETLPVPVDGSLEIYGSAGPGGAPLFGENCFNDEVLVSYQNFIKPPSLYLVRLGRKISAIKIKSGPASFDGSKYEVLRANAPSKDGLAAIPYFVVKAKDAKLDGSNPVILYAYGGFGAKETQLYQDIAGKLWLERGGIYVQANIRGGGEFGPEWHTAAVRENRPRSFEDLISVAEALISRGITSPRHLGIKGISNGGLLVSAVYAKRPELFGAMHSESGLHDMLRYPEFYGGQGQLDEYGDPKDGKMRAVLASYSPYHNLRPGAVYPRAFLEARTDDTHVFPVHSRKMALHLLETGNPVYFLETPSGGHTGSEDPEEKAKHDAREYVYFWEQLK